MIIGPNRYAENELLAPREDELKKHPGFERTPTMDAGYCHRFMFGAFTPALQDAKVRKFFNMMAETPGYSTLSLREFKLDITERRFCLDVVYTIETPFTGVR